MEIPLGRAANRAEPLVERVGVRPPGVEFFEHRKPDAVLAAAEGLDLLFAPRLLAAEVIGRKAQNHQPLVAVRVVQ